MQHFKHITYLDTFDVVAKLHKLNPIQWPGMAYRGEIGDVRLPARSLALRVHKDPDLDNWLQDLPVEDTPIFKKWDSLQRILNDARLAILNNPDIKGSGYIDETSFIQRVMITGLQAQGCITWHKDNGPYHERHVRFHVALVTNPGVMMYSGPESIHMDVGHLWAYDNRGWHSAANFGLHTRYHLIFEINKSDRVGRA